MTVHVRKAITAANVNSAVTNLILPQDIVTEIRNSAAAGKTVTVHERPIDFYGNSQIGYVILDPETGAGAYKIGGGENGAEIASAFSGIYGWASTLIEVAIKAMSGTSTGWQAFKFILGKIGGGIGGVASVLGLISDILTILSTCKNSLSAIIAVIISLAFALLTMAVASAIATTGLGLYIFLTLVDTVVGEIRNALKNSLWKAVGC